MPKTISLPIRVLHVATPRSRIVRLDLRGQAYEFRAGQAVMVGQHGQSLRKPYSIANAPEEVRRDGYIELLVQVKHDGKPGRHLKLETGVLVDVEGPYGAFYFPERPAERRFLFIAGGTGIAPLRAMLHHALLGRRTTEIGVVYSARAPEEFAYQAELRHLARSGRIDLRQTVTRGHNSSWKGHRGRIDLNQLAPMIHDSATLCFICGPPALVDDVPPMLHKLGIPKSRIRMDEWG